MKTLLILLLFTSTAFAQDAPFTVGGTLKTPSGNIWVGATVTATKVLCGDDLYIMAGQTGVDGKYFFGGLEKGKYLLEAKGKFNPKYWQVYFDKHGELYKMKELE